MRTILDIFSIETLQKALTQSIEERNYLLTNVYKNEIDKRNEKNI